MFSFAIKNCGVPYFQTDPNCIVTDRLGAGGVAEKDGIWGFPRQDNQSEESQAGIEAFWMLKIYSGFTRSHQSGSMAALLPVCSRIIL